MDESSKTEYLIPAGYAAAEFVEKRSRFIGQVWPVETEEQARQLIAETKSKYYDARHSCWCFIIREGGIMRYSDDGEPQGTAGQPMLEIFRRRSVQNVCCVVTRYFGGILLGAGGLVRAYSHTANLALDTAGIAIVRSWSRFLLECPYGLFQRVRTELEAIGGTAEDTEYGSNILLTVLVPEGTERAFAARMADLSAGTISLLANGTALKAVPLKNS